MNERARFCRTTRASSEKLSFRPSSSTLLFFGALCFLARAMSRAVPASLVNAVWRCSTYDREEPASGSAARLSPPSGALGFLELTVTEIVVPKRECRVFALRANSRLRWSSAASNEASVLDDCFA